MTFLSRKQALFYDCLRFSTIIGMDSMKFMFCDAIDGWVIESNHSLTEDKLNDLSRFT